VDGNASLNKKAEQYPEAKKFVDFRKMLEEMGKDRRRHHFHAGPPARRRRHPAMKMGKHIYLPEAAHPNVFEARELIRQLAKEKKLATQMGNQGSAGTACAAPSKSFRPA
jgi:hypothetical protein